MINKYAKMLGILRKLKMKISRRCLNQMFLSFVKPILEYADVVWDSCSDIFSNSLPVDLNSLIYGNDTLTDTQNEILFGIVQNYIKETKRFVWIYFTL